MNAFSPLLRQCLGEAQAHCDASTSAQAIDSRWLEEVIAKLEHAEKLTGAVQIEQAVVDIAVAFKKAGLRPSEVMPSFATILDALKTKWERSRNCRLR